MKALMCLALGALNIPAIAANPTGAAWSWAGLVFCVLMGMACAAMER